jgi:ribonuclease BN (tRNA processing enzyme)
MDCDRRTALAAALATAVVPLVPLTAAAGADRGTRLILLGTAGGPRPRKRRSGSAQAIVVGDEIFVIDCGDGVARQMVLAGLPLRQLRHVFITHHHSDHNIDLGALLQLAWISGLVTPVDCWGPPPTRRMIGDYLRYQEHDIAVRVSDEGRVPLTPLIRSHDVHGSGPVLDDGHVRVTAAKVPHPPLELALAYRFDAPDRSIVISGDTRESDELVRLAAGADVLVHEAMLAERVREMLRTLPNSEALARSVISHHTTAEQVGRVAAAAGVKMLVLSHFVPAEDPDVVDEEWLAPVRRHYSGPVMVGRDLMVI